VSEIATASTIQLLGAAGFGILIGWYVYYINRYRKGDVQLSDLVTLIAAIGGGAVLALFPAGTDLFGAYGIGLFVGFFGYFIILVILVTISAATTGNFNSEWFLDGRRKKPDGTWIVPEDVPQHPLIVGSSAKASEQMPEQEPVRVMIVGGAPPPKADEE
jgi:hypothetical protein